MTDTTQQPRTCGDVGAGAPTFAEALPGLGQDRAPRFGGPAGQIALMHRMLVDEKKWIDEQRYLVALNFCMLLPGPEAMQLATYAGWRLHGLGRAGGRPAVRAARRAGGAGAVGALCAFGKLPLVEALFFGVKAAVLAIVVEALLRVARRALKGSIEWAIAAAAFVAIFSPEVPFPLIVAAAALVGFWRSAVHRRCHACRPPLRRRVADCHAAHGRDLARHLAGAAARSSPLFGTDHVLTEIGWFFSKLAVVTFGGAYAVLAYMAQDVVEHYGWLTRRRDARRPGPRRDDAGAADPGHRVRGLPGGLPRGRRQSLGDGRARRRGDAVGDLRALLPVDLRRRALYRAAQRRAAACGRRWRRSRRRWWA